MPAKATRMPATAQADSTREARSSRDATAARRCRTAVGTGTSDTQSRTGADARRDSAPPANARTASSVLGPRPGMAQSARQARCSAVSVPVSVSAIPVPRLFPTYIEVDPGGA
ncbi:hypothetical protein COSO111634_35070 [Corallococcus soli]